MANTHKSQFGRMFTELILRHRERTSEQSSKPFGKSAKDIVAFLDLRNGGGRQRWPYSGYILGDHSSIAWRGLDAQFWGVAQRRKRVFLVFDLGGQCAGRILFEREGLQRDFKAVRRKGQAPRPAAETSPAGHDCVFAVENHAQDCRVSLSPGNIVQTLAGRMGTGGGNVPLVLVPCYGQTSYDEYEPMEQAVTLKARGGNYGGGEQRC